MSERMTASEVLRGGLGFPMPPPPDLTLLRLEEKVETLGYAVSALQDALLKVIANQARLESALKAHGVGAWAGLA